MDQLDADGDFKVSSEELAEVTGVEYSFNLASKDQSNTFTGLIFMRKF
jgi:hypothetical protein